MSTKNIMIVGVGGQGTLLTSRILGGLMADAGYDVKISEVHGMAQRGGSVVTFVRYGEKVAEPIVEEGQAAVGPYLAFLKSGCTEDPVSLLKIAGVDLSAGTPVDEALAVFDAAISEMEALYLSEEDSH